DLRRLARSQVDGVVDGDPPSIPRHQLGPVPSGGGGITVEQDPAILRHSSVPNNRALLEPPASTSPYPRATMSQKVSSPDDQDLLEAERDIRAKLGTRDFDFESMQAIANIYRAAAAVRRRAEREVLA